MSTKVLENALRKLRILSNDIPVVRSDSSLVYYPGSIVSSYEIVEFHRFAKYFDISVGIEHDTKRLYVYFRKM